MFCPNCGKDCADARFCTACGTQLKDYDIQEQRQRETQKKAWVEGAPCPYCGGLQTQDGKCVFCGVQLSEKHVQPVEEEKRPLEIPCGTYNGITSSLTLYETECVVRATILLFIKYETRIPYDKIKSVVYIRPLYKASSIGYVLFRWEENETLPIPINNNFSADHTTITTATGRDTLFYHIFYMLKAIAPTTAEFRMVIPTVDVPGLKTLETKVNLDSYYDEYAPLRRNAVEALRKRTGATEEQAKALIDRTFDERQKVAYEKDPQEAIHDLNLFVKEKKRLDEQAAKEREAKKERNRREAAMYEHLDR